jgi:hypothetical protein
MTLAAPHDHCRAALLTLTAPADDVDPRELRAARIHAARCPNCAGALADDDNGDASQLLATLAPLRPSPSRLLRLALGLLCGTQIVLGVPWLVGANLIGGTVDERHLTRDGAFALTIAAAGLIVAYQPRYARPLLAVCLAVLALHVVAGVSDRSADHVHANFELMHLLAAAITSLVALIGHLPRWRAAPHATRHRVVR